MEPKFFIKYKKKNLAKRKKLARKEQFRAILSCLIGLGLMTYIVMQRFF